MRGKVYLIGCGPGPPDLMTVRAVKILRDSDVVLYDRLVNSQVLEYAKDAEKIDVGKTPGEPDKQDKINRLLYSKAQEGEVVARLKNGNPMIFARGGEELQFLQEGGVEVEIVPGLSSATSLPLLAGIPLTKRGVSSSVSILTGYEAGGKDPSWESVGDSAVVLMTVGNLPRVVENLLECGRSGDTFSALISSGATDEERLLLSPLSQIVEMAEVVGMKPPAVLISGGVVEELLRLDGRKVAIFRPGREEERTKSLIREAGGIPSFYKVCDIDTFDASELEEALTEEWDALVFMSPNGVRSAAKLVDVGEFRTVAVGNRTRAVLEEFGAERVVMPELHSSKGVERLLAGENWKALALRSSLNEEKIKGARNVTAYTVRPEGVHNALENYLASSPEYTVLTSSGILELLVKDSSKRGTGDELKEKINESFVITLGRKTTQSVLAEDMNVNFELPRPDLGYFFEKMTK